MKYIASILFLCSFLILSFSKNIIMLDFYLNRDAIALKYCINKYKPGLHCNGHCFLVKQLRKEQQQETKDLGEQLGKMEAVAFHNHFPELKPVSFPLTLKRNYVDNYRCNYIQDISLLVFKPPRA